MKCLCRRRGARRHISNPFSTLALEGDGWSATCNERFTPWVGHGTGLDGHVKPSPTGIRFLVRPARSESLSDHAIAAAKKEGINEEKEAGKYVVQQIQPGN
jgi:hypothetical protein